MSDKELIDILERAIEEEVAAKAFYEEAARTTNDPGGRSMFMELAFFEQHHKEHLEALRDSLAAKSGFIRYPPKTIGSAAEGKPGRPAVGPKDDILSALRTAIAAEEKAQAIYRGIADTTDDPDGKEMFSRLAEEESLHRRMLDDQYYALSNRGEWLWGD